MALVLTEEQQILKTTAGEFIAAQAPITHLRSLRDNKDPSGFSSELWKKMAELGWAGLVDGEDHGGVGLGYLELGTVAEECGRTLVPTPLLSSVAFGGECIRRGASEPQKSQILSGLAAGEKVLAVALEEKPRFAPYAAETRAEKDGDGYRLTGEKTFVLDGHIADRLIVVARTSAEAGEREGLSLFLVDPAASGVTRTRTVMVDSRNAARIQFENTPAEALLGEIDKGADILDPAIDRATAVLCAEMVGLMQEAFDRTIEYLKTREQFGVKIGTFQGLKHRAAAMFSELELSRSIVLETLSAIDDDGPDVPTLVCVAKARCSDAAGLISRETLQMHGGIGMTDEADIGLFLKRARVAELSFGDGSYHRARFASMQGY